MRRYWVPVLLSSEVAEPDGPPVRAQILDEKLIALRNTEGKIGLVDEFCSHRGASLYFGRNEENGIRCAYHGLKFAIDGQCVDVPSAPQACKHMGIKANEYIKADGNVIFEIESAPFGLTLYGRRNGEPDSYYWRVTQWLFPWFTLIPPFGDHALGGHVWVPIDDHRCWAWSVNFRPDRPLSEEE